MIHSNTTRTTRPLRLVAVGLVAAVVLLGCGGSDDGAGSSDAATPLTTGVDSLPSGDDSLPSGERQLAGIVRDPAPVVDETTLPSLTNPGEDVVFRADPGGFKVVYFGYTNCPDVCPTTMADWAVTLRRLPPELSSQISTVMITVDPDRDNDLLPGYVESFVPGAEAGGSTDADRLAAAAEPFGVSYSVVTTGEGDIEVSHSGFLYMVDDQGRLAVTWPFGMSSQEIAADVEQLFAEQAAS